MMFDTFDRTGAAEFPFPKRVVFRALSDAVNSLNNMRVENCDELALRLDIKTGITLFSWGESVSVAVSASGDHASKVSVQSAAKTIFGSATTHGRNRRNVRDIISRTSEILQEHGVAWSTEMAVAPSASSVSTPSPQVSVADELSKLAQLRDKGIIDESEFQAQKGRLLRSK